MSAPAGYKATEVGVIPEDWEVERLGALLSQKPSYGINAPAAPYDDRLPRYLRITDITEDGGFSNSSPVSVSHIAANRYFLSPGDLVFARTGASTGKSYRYRATDGPLVYAGFLIRVSPNPDRLNAKYLAAHVKTRQFTKYVAEVSQRSGQPGINGKQLADFSLPVPPTVTEQSAIAEALSDANEAIAAVEAVIAKKRALNTATMQAFLSGARRLPGFTGKWESRPLSALCSMKSGFGITSKSLADHGRYPCFGGNGFRGFTDRYTHEGLFPLIGRVGALCGNVTLADGRLFASEHAIVVTPNEETSARWLAIVLRDLNLNRFSEASAQPVLVVSKLLLINCVTPPDKEEQEAIALVATDMDADISASERKLEKLRRIRAGMMQQLLTGKIRLV